MERTIAIDPHDAAPIWRQIEERVRRLVAGGSLAPGTAVPSVRDLAQQLRVNPATVAKAYQRLVDAGVLEVRRGAGTFVTTNPPRIGAAERTKILREAALRFATAAISVGASQDEAGGAIAAAWSELNRGGSNA